ncbi:D-tyrosyl-tRNA(Tyr) deacylase [Candidatus Nitromaritima sp. SCGC AAA799-C22]|nr:D-tyrosyl-tRNA(Tyr) deacylase [Candidatus Nitromaritima sp. SCGC AAA799-C22]
MKLVLQRVSSASVSVGEQEIACIGKGLLVLFGAEKGDGEAQADFLAEKTLNLRVFPDENGKMNFSCLDIEAEILVVSQFTLAGDCSRGRRPGFDRAADPETARTLYEHYVGILNRSGLPIATGKFAADMKVSLVNDGPVTFLLER